MTNSDLFLAIRNPRLSAHCRGIKLMLNAILDPNLSVIQESLLLALVYLLNNEETRKYIRPSLDLAVRTTPENTLSHFFLKDTIGTT